MRLWSIHPCYLDTKGLTACWREGLLARKVISGETKGYRNHPQLLRFRDTGDPVGAVDAYLYAICDEAEKRGYRFDRGKLGMPAAALRIMVNSGQVEYETSHLLNKLSKRDKEAFGRLSCLEKDGVLPHPLFEIVPGPVKCWEIVD